jgi:hypothetical protein
VPSACAPPPPSSWLFTQVMPKGVVWLPPLSPTDSSVWRTPRVPVPPSTLFSPLSPGPGHDHLHHRRGMAPRAHLRTDGGHVCTTGKQAELTPSQHPGHPAMGTRLAPTFGSKVRKLLEAWCLSPCSDADAPHCAPVHPQHHTGGVWCVGGIAGRKGVCGGGHSHVFGPGLGEGWVATSLLLTPMCGTCTHPTRNARASSPVCV